jgi:type III secretion protein R
MFQTDPFALIALFVGLSLVAFIAMIATSYLKIVVVVSLVRNALGIQSIPPNMVVNALALILTFYIMAPVVGESWDLFNKYREENKPEKEFRTDLALKSAEPLRKWLVRQTGDRERAFFVTTAERLWAGPDEEKSKVDPESFHILIPSFCALMAFTSTSVPEFHPSAGLTHTRYLTAFIPNSFIRAVHSLSAPSAL